ncbi:hypothetical protein [Rhizobium ruizarguesonis]|uniref:hypothetical protein n=1 Tax=Rhizobium ruizarguesonis TaxID=2081791 RepID=UPI001FDEC5BC|nr:hypothetical protein [Rhizobium ruizarguesonis]
MTTAVQKAKGSATAPTVPSHGSRSLTKETKMNSNVDTSKVTEIPALDDKTSSNGMSVQLLQSRERLEAQIEALIGLLDLLDVDPDFEPDNDNEPSLGAPEHVVQTHWYSPVSAEVCDTELEDENDEDGGDIEPNGDEQDSSFTEDDAGGFCQ